jgi:deoxycytidylate deaminase
MVATILNEQNRIIATGHAEEKRKASQINSTSALENCETSAIGRALAGAGFGGSEFASANEVQNAIQQQNPAVDKAINAIKEAGSMEALKIVYTAAIRQFKSEADLAKINAAKDARKAEL